MALTKICTAMQAAMPPQTKPSAVESWPLIGAAAVEVISPRKWFGSPVKGRKEKEEEDYEGET